MPFIVLRSFNRGDNYIRHQNFEGELQPLDFNAIDDFTFEEEDLGKDENNFHLVRFRSKNFTDRLLRHKDFRIVLDVNDGSEQFRNDSTFRRSEGLAGTVGDEWRSYEAINFNGRFIRHRDFHIFIDERPNPEDQLFNEDATFTRTGVPQPIDNNP